MNIHESKYHKISSYKNKKFLDLLTTIKKYVLKDGYSRLWFCKIKKNEWKKNIIKSIKRKCKNDHESIKEIFLKMKKF